MSTTPQAPNSQQVANLETTGSAAAGSLLVGGNGLGNESYIKLSQGNPLDDRAALELAKSRPVQWIVLAGPTRSGKTTLLTSLYEMLQWKPIEGYEFAGSNTLPAFEERCYLSRRESGNPLPHTRRTPYEPEKPFFLHLRLRAIGGLRPFRDILFTDVSGEMFEDARDSTDECKKLHFLRRANHLVLFLDSEIGLQDDQRWAMVEDCRALLQSCVYSNMIGPRCEVHVVWSRFDYFAAEDDPLHKVFREEVERELRNSFCELIPRKLIFSEVAARPLTKQNLGMGFGVAPLLKQWADTPSDLNASDLFPTSFSGERESELFANRHYNSISET